MKINQLLENQTIDLDYIPDDYILRQIQVQTRTEFQDIADQYKKGHIIMVYNNPKDREMLKKIIDNSEISITNPDWDRCVYYEDDRDQMLLLVYPGRMVDVFVYRVTTEGGNVYKDTWIRFHKF